MSHFIREEDTSSDSRFQDFTFYFNNSELDHDEPPSPYQTQSKSGAIGGDGFGGGSSKNGEKCSKDSPKSKTKNVHKVQKQKSSTTSKVGSKDGFNGGSGEKRCDRCKVVGHSAKECPNKRVGSDACKKCGKDGHFVRECPDKENDKFHPNKQTKKCRTCGEVGHFASVCSNAEATDRASERPAHVTSSQSKKKGNVFKTITQGINFDKYDEIPVKISGNGNIPKPIKSFKEAGIYKACMENARKAKYVKPTPVQKHAIPIILGKRDLMACAQTGSGKTAAFLLPVLTAIQNDGLSGNQFNDVRAPVALVLSPTRELTNQIYMDARQFAHTTNLRTAACHGGVIISQQLRQIKKGCHMLIATPGRLKGFVERKKILLSKVKYLILDEVDRMNDMGIVKTIMEDLGMPGKDERQTLMFSATFPDEIQRLAAEFLDDHIFLTVAKVDDECLGIEQVVQEVPEAQKRKKLAEILRSEVATDGEAGERPARATYVPPTPTNEEIFKTISQGINFDKYDDIKAKVSGDGHIPKQIMSFEEAGIYEAYMENVRKIKYVKPTPVQKYAIPIILSKRDLLACAQTGSGKTAAFLLPVLTALHNDGLSGSQFSDVPAPVVLVISPTRELTSQIYLEVRKFAHKTSLTAAVCYGRVSVSHQLENIKRGCHVLVATPGRLKDFVERNNISLGNVKYLILDEADKMLDMGFMETVKTIIDDHNMPGKGKRQTLMFSATFPDEIIELAADFLDDYVFLAVGKVGCACFGISQKVLEVPRAEAKKRQKLVEILETEDNNRNLIFVETKKAAASLASFLSESEFPATSIHSKRTQKQREEALRDFKDGTCPVLIATAVAARGLDIDHVEQVINYDLPREINEYVHKIGRTGRIGNTGRALSFFCRGRDEHLARGMVKVLADSLQVVPDWLEEVAETALGTEYGPRGGKFGAKDIRKVMKKVITAHKDPTFQPMGITDIVELARLVIIENFQIRKSDDGDPGGSGTSS